MRVSEGHVISIRPTSLCSHAHQNLAYDASTSISITLLSTAFPSVFITVTLFRQPQRERGGVVLILSSTRFYVCPSARLSSHILHVYHGSGDAIPIELSACEYQPANWRDLQLVSHLPLVLRDVLAWPPLETSIPQAHSSYTVPHRVRLLDPDAS